jgi:hypothetical protein
MALPASLFGQVGYPPAASPYRDVENGARGSVFAGWYAANHDPAGVFPKSAPMFGVRWDVFIGGPADFTARIATAPTKRDVIDPSKPAGQRFVESKSIALSMADIGIAFNLTGNKSWHALLPQANASVGLISDFQGRDAGGYSHGTTFALYYGLGVRMVPPEKRLSLRADVGSFFYSTQYPSSYFTPSSDGTFVVPGTQSGGKWRNNWAFTLGATYVVFR